MSGVSRRHKHKWEADRVFATTLVVPMTPRLTSSRGARTVETGGATRAESLRWTARSLTAIWT
eukprot:3612801-Prymnesium_polylepis.1